VAVAGGALFLIEGFKIRNVRVEGSTHYTPVQIKNMVITDKFSENSLYLKYKLKAKKIEDIPFVEHMDVVIEDRNSIKIIVYEKAVAGYVVYLENRMYFDKDGIVVESSDIPTDGLPLVTGLEFDSFNMYAPLPVSNESIFQTILDLTHALEVNGLSTDEINFDSSYRITVSVGRIKLSLGSGDKLAEKIQMASKLLKKKELAGKTGVLHLENYMNGNEKYYFKVTETN
jgi:cell division protein FtsQ